MSQDSLSKNTKKFAPLYSRVGIAFAIFLLSIVSFVYIADQVTDGDTLKYDQDILTAINSTSSESQDVFWYIITQFGGFVAVPIIAVAAAFWLYRKGEIQKCLTIIFGIGGAVLLNAILKLIFERDRPDLWVQLVNETSHSFPSGHAMASASIAVSVVLVFWNTKWRLWALLGGIIYMVLIGYSRLYLGVHYPTDILAGWAMSTAWVVLVAIVIRYVLKKYRSLKQSDNAGGNG